MDVPEIDVTEVENNLAAGAALLDVRELDEVETARIPGVHHIPLMDLPSRVNEVSSPVLVVCASGGRSRKAAEFLIGQGVEAINVAGGTKAWLAAGLPHEQGPIGQ